MKPKVVILSAFLSPYRSGAEACVEEVALRLSESFDITVVTSKRFSQEGLLQGKVPVIRVGTGLPIDKWLYPFLAPFAVRRLRPQLVHAVLETFAGLALHLCMFTTPQAKRFLTLQTLNRSFLKAMIVRSPHIVTAISSALKRVASDLGRMDITVIPNGIDMKNIELRSSTSSERPEALEGRTANCEKIPGRILFVGRLEPMKGIDILLEAFSKICEEFPQAHLRIVGDGSLRSKLQATSHELQVAHRVTFTGYVSHPDVYKEYAEAGIFCALSRSEALGNVFLEAQAAGCAVVGTNIGGIPEIVEHGRTGFLVEPDNPRAAADALSRLLSDTTLRSAFSLAGKESAKQYDWGTIAERYRQIYDRLLF